MKSLILGAVLITAFVINGCATKPDMVGTTSRAARSDVFNEIAASETAPGKAIAVITFSVKSNSSRFVNMYTKHSNPHYHVHVNIDGQETTLEADPVLEIREPIDSKLPESGTGWKYQFSKRIALTPGKHVVAIALPVDDVMWEGEVELRSGLNTISVMPVYNDRLLRPFKGENFTAGVDTLEVTVH
jgi:hypothetical protein